MKDPMPYAPNPMPFAGSQLDFTEVNRAAEQVQAYLNDPNAKALIFVKGKPALTPDLRPIALHPKDLNPQNLYDPGPLFLGLNRGAPIFAYSLEEGNTVAAQTDFQDLRMAASRMTPDDLGMIGRARAFLDWHYNHRFCAKCGTKSSSVKYGLMRACPSCGAEHYPRVNPVVIMMVTYEDSCLLGAGHNFPEGAFSALAGFVSPGETPEEAVLREVKEEVGLDVTNPKYVFSQPWPFPSQLMLGFHCEAASYALSLDKKELKDARWFSKETVRDVFAKRSDAFLRPPRFTIAHHLIRRWLSEEG